MDQNKKIIRNRCRCKRCGQIIESHHRHDYVTCLCGAIFTDGGHDYIRRGYDPSYGSMEDLIDPMDICEEV